MTPTETRVEWRNVYEGTDWTITCATREEADKYGDGLWLGTRLAPRIAVERIETTTTITRIPVREEQAGMSERTMLDGLPLCARCGLLAADHVVMVTACDGFVTAPSEDFAKTPDAVGVARLVAEMAKQASLGHKRFCVGIHDHGELGVEEEWEDWSATFARFESRVRAECAAKVRGFAELVAAYPTDVWPETPFTDAQAASVLRLMLPRIEAQVLDTIRGLAAPSCEEADCGPLEGDVERGARKVLACGRIAADARVVFGDGTAYKGFTLGSHADPLTFGELRAMARRIVEGK